MTPLFMCTLPYRVKAVRQNPNVDLSVTMMPAALREGAQRIREWTLLLPSLASITVIRLRCCANLAHSLHNAQHVDLTCTHADARSPSPERQEMSPQRSQPEPSPMLLPTPIREAA